MIYEYTIIQCSNIDVGGIEHIEYPEQRESFFHVLHTGAPLIEFISPFILNDQLIRFGSAC
jgi:hypothetical protein